MRIKKIIDSDEVPILPRFPSAAYDVVVTFLDGTIEVIKVMARGKAAAIQTACYSMTKWDDNKIPNIATVSFHETLTRDLPMGADDIFTPVES